MIQGKFKAAQLRMEGTTRIKKKKGKRSHFDTRKNKTMTEWRRAHSGPRTDTTKTGLEDILVEASNHSDGEAEDVEMM